MTAFLLDWIAMESAACRSDPTATATATATATTACPKGWTVTGTKAPRWNSKNSATDSTANCSDCSDYSDSAKTKAMTETAVRLAAME